MCVSSVTVTTWCVCPQVVAALFASLSAVSIGFITGYSSMVLPQLANDTSIDYNEARDAHWIGMRFSTLH